MSMNVTVISGQIYNVSSGQTDTGDIVFSGGVLNVASGGTIDNTVNDGGIDNVYGIAISTTVTSNGTQNVYGSAAFTTVSGGSFFPFPFFANVFYGATEEVFLGWNGDQRDRRSSR
jgi:autotransporter passenger strand-loop-strand repeat protein